MGTNTNAARNAQLGIPFGTAMHRLRKMIVFRLLQRLGESVCFKCSLDIKTVEELSIEHKEPWLNVSPDLFWDLDNLAWSHVKCNRPDRQYRVYKNPLARKHAQIERRRNDPVLYAAHLEEKRRAKRWQRP